METLQSGLSELAGHEWLELALIFIGTFFAEEAVLLAAAALAAAGELSIPAAAGTFLAGIIVSDSVFFGIGRLAARAEWLRRRIRPETLERGRHYLMDELPLALIAARVVPGLVYPIFIGCGFLAVGFRRLMLLNLLVTTIYTALLFTVSLLLGKLAFAYLQDWGWLAIGLLALGLGVVAHWLGWRTAKRFAASRAARAADAPRS